MFYIYLYFIHFQRSSFLYVDPGFSLVLSLSASGTPFIISYSADLLVMNLVFVHLKKVVLSPSSLKDIFAGYRILDSQFFFLSAF